MLGTERGAAVAVESEKPKKSVEKALEDPVVLQRLKGFIRSLVSGGIGEDREEVIKDLFQDTVEKALRNKNNFEAKSSVLTWLGAIARNSFLDKKRRARTKGTRTSFEELVPSQEPVVEPKEDDIFLRRRLKESWGDISPEDREVLTQKGMGHSNEEIAIDAKKTDAATKNHIHRARGRLAEKLESRGVVLPFRRKTKKAEPTPQEEAVNQ